MRRGSVRPQMVEALPFFDDDERVRTVLGAGTALGVDRRAVFDAAGFGVDRRHVGAEMPQHLVALAGLGGYDGDNVNHVSVLCC